MKNIIFNVDRTLIDSYYSEMITLKQAIKEVTNRDILNDDMNKLSSMVTNDFFKLIGIDINSNTYSLINKRWEELLEITPTRCFNGIKNLIKELYNNGFFLGIITSRNLDEFHELEEELKDIIGYFKIIVTSDMVKRPKPNSNSFELIKQKYDINIDDTLYAGDSELDFEFANNCNIKFIQAAWDKSAMNGCLYAENISELRNMILNGKDIHKK